MRHPSLVLVGLLLSGILLMSCTPAGTRSTTDELSDNPLTAEFIADQMIEYVTVLQIRADESGEPITDPKVLRVIDDVFVKQKVLQKQAHKRQDSGKMGSLYGVNGNFAQGKVLLEQGKLYFGFMTSIDPAPGMKILLSQHVTPHTVEDLFSVPTLEVAALQTPYGTQTYNVQKLSTDDWNKYRTVALYSEPLNTVIALAQIRSRAGEGEEE